MKRFNTTGVCIPEKHYMVDLTERVRAIGEMVDAGDYFTINRARQYGKTTTIAALERGLSRSCTVISLDFQDVTEAAFSSENGFARELAMMLCDTRDALGIPMPEEIYETFRRLGEEERGLSGIFRAFDQWCRVSEKPVVLIIDEVDQASGHQPFRDFLGKLRSNYIKREKNGRYKTFQSVILAGVADIRYLRSRIRDESEHRVNSPWNIAADFRIDMSLSESGICGMLEEYEGDHGTGMDVAAMAKRLREYTNGYPFLVSRLCQLMDTVVAEQMQGTARAWTPEGFEAALRLILKEDNTLFQSLTGKLVNKPELKEALRRVLMEGEKLAYNADQEEMSQLRMYGFVTDDGSAARIANRIFETRLYNLYLSDEEIKSSPLNKEADLAKNRFVRDGRLDMPLLMERFIDAYTQIFGPLRDRFKEKDGREQFLLYLRPIINGTGNYYIEAQTRDQTRTDVVVDYLGEQYVIELKIWRGERYHAEGEEQISEYLDYFGLDTGYMLSFNFNQKKEPGVKRVQVGDKVLYEGTV